MNREPTILYEDASIVAVDKPAGILSIPDRYDPDAPVLRSLLAPGYGTLMVVHRLDKDTSGVLVFARDAGTHRTLNGAFGTRAVRKIYHALVSGPPDWDETGCSLPLRVDGDRQHRTIVDAHSGKPSSTAFRVLARYRHRALVEAIPETGRTHQIRVHLASLGHPVVADPLYGDGRPLLLSSFKRGWKGDPHDERPLLARTALHACSMEFVHPANGNAVRIEAPYPRDFRASVSQLSNP